MGSIVSFEDMTRQIKRKFEYVSGTGDEAIYDNTKEKPVISMIGYEKQHGSCLGVSYSKPDGFWTQSRSRIIEPNTEQSKIDKVDLDNGSSAKEAYERKDEWLDIIFKLADTYNIDLNQNIITVFSEWMNGGKKSSVTGLSHRCMIFKEFKVSPLEPEEAEGTQDREKISYWLDTNNIDNPEVDIYNVTNMPSVEVLVDFNEPKKILEKINELVLICEANSPTGKFFGKDGNIGEGYVFTFRLKPEGPLLRFKVKGTKHAKGNREHKPLTPEEIAENKKIIDFVNDFTCKESRLTQAKYEVCNIINGGIPSKANIGDFIKWIIKDNIKEHQEDMKEAGIEDPRTLNKAISAYASRWFLEELEAEAFN